MLLKLGLKSIQHNLLMNVLVVLQMAVVFVLLISMVSTATSRFKLYAPFSEELNGNGYFYRIDYGINPKTNMTLRTTEEFCDLIYGEEKVMGVYIPWLFYMGDERFTVSYDRELIEKFTPELESGVWLDTNRENSELVQVVVSQNPYGFKVGDIITMFCFENPVKAEIVGILKENARIIGCPNASSNASDCRAIYGNYSFEREEVPLFLFNQEELLDKQVVMQMNGPVFVIYPDDVRESVIKKNDSVIRQMEAYNIQPFRKMKADSLTYIFSQLLDLMPIFICVLILTLVGAVSTSALSAKRQLRTYAVYYICGLKWKQCAVTNFWSSLFCVGSSFLLGVLAAFVIKTSGLFGETVIEFGAWQLFSCLAISIVYVLLSILLPLHIIGSSTPKQVLQAN